MEQHNDWAQQYLTPEQQAAIAELRSTAYSPAAQQQLATWGAAWTAEDQRRLDAEYAQLAAGLQAAVAAGKPAGDPAVQALAATFLALIARFTHGDPEVASGLATFWQNHAALPAAQQFPLPWGPAEQTLLEAALALHPHP